MLTKAGETTPAFFIEENISLHSLLNKHSHLLPKSGSFAITSISAIFNQT
jgi:hypothetical protein